MRRLLVLATMTLATACSEATGVSQQTFVVPVDTIQAPDSIGPQDTLAIRLSGTIGNSTCYAFSRFQSARTRARLDLAVIGVHRFDINVGCRQATVPLDTTFTTPPPFDDPFRVVIHQPDGDSLVHSVIVR